MKEMKVSLAKVGDAGNEEIIANEWVFLSEEAVSTMSIGQQKLALRTSLEGALKDMGNKLPTILDQGW